MATTKKKATTKANPNAPLGSGGRFKAFVDKAVASGESEKEASASAAIAGREKYGAKKMAKMAAAGKKK